MYISNAGLNEADVNELCSYLLLLLGQVALMKLIKLFQISERQKV